MQHYAKFGHTEFVIALGYKAEVIRDYFLNFNSLNSDFTVDLADGSIEWINSSAPNWKVTLVDTGLDSLTGTRLKKLAPHLEGNRFMLTYGDGVANVDIEELLSFHNKHGRQVTMTAVRPSARFGELDINAGQVKSFEEKPQLHSGWINGGFFVMEPGFLNYIPDENVMLERSPFNNATADGELMAFEHQGFWQCMDTKRDMDGLQALWDSGIAPWTV
jgi:glucose-1-phosphate cytidylyltransferase|tara:strand:+ start:3919 stop:4572 length:654 start_codon:yes stop_codon:yes gene_type:complete